MTQISATPCVNGEASTQQVSSRQEHPPDNGASTDTYSAPSIVRASDFRQRPTRVLCIAPPPPPSASSSALPAAPLSVAASMVPTPPTPPVMAGTDAALQEPPPAYRRNRWEMFTWCVAAAMPVAAAALPLLAFFGVPALPLVLGALLGGAAIFVGAVMVLRYFERRRAQDEGNYVRQERQAREALKKDV